MLSLNRFRVLLGNQAEHLSDEEVLKARDQMYALAELVAEKFNLVRKESEGGIETEKPAPHRGN